MFSTILSSIKFYLVHMYIKCLLLILLDWQLWNSYFLVVSVYDSFTINEIKKFFIYFLLTFPILFCYINLQLIVIYYLYIQTLWSILLILVFICVLWFLYINNYMTYKNLFLAFNYQIVFLFLSYWLWLPIECRLKVVIAGTFSS